MVAGLITSVHCVAMCGPLSCAFAPSRPDQGNPLLVLTCYHLAKLCAYGLVGALAGTFGSVVIRLIEHSWLNYLPWILVLLFIAVAFRLDRFLLKPRWLGGCYHRATRAFVQLTKPVAAVMIGLASPLLPCGPLYLIFGLALFSGSAWQGAECAIGFGIGTVPLLWLAQSQYMHLNRSMGSKWLSRVQRIVALIAALVVAWRLRTTLGIEGAENWICHPF